MDAKEIAERDHAELAKRVKLVKKGEKKPKKGK